MSGAKVTIRFISYRVRYLQLGWFVWAVVMLPVHAGGMRSRGNHGRTVKPTLFARPRILFSD